MVDFTALFDKWALNYDQTVYDTNNEYSEVFEDYDKILETICNNISDKKSGILLEIGVGTGNLTELLFDNGFKVIGIEPSQEMRKVAIKKLPNIEFLNGHFLDIPIEKKIDAIVSSYAFHHLNLNEKRDAVKYLDSFLKEDGKIIIADTMFETEDYKQEIYKYVENSKGFNLLKDLNTEYYEYLKDVCKIFEELNYTVSTKQMNKYVWIVSAKKGEINNEKSRS